MGVDWNAIVLARLRDLGADPPLDFVEELALHLAQIHEDALARGLGDAVARARALAVLDAAHPLRQALAAKVQPRHGRIHEWARGEPVVADPHGGMMSKMNVIGDVRHALRLLARTPGFSTVAILTFAVGIGVNTAVFSVVNGVLLRALPYPDADRITLVWLDNRRMNIHNDITSFPNYRDWRDQNSSYAALAAFSPTSFALTGAGEPERVLGAETTANYFDVMGIQPLIGRMFTPANEAPGHDAVVVLSYGLWQRRFGGDAAVTGRTISLNGTPHEIIGVMPREMTWPANAEFWKPLAPDQNLREARSTFWLPVIGRLKDGIRLEQAQTEMSGISARLEQQYSTNRGYGASVVPLRREIVGNMKTPLMVLSGAVGFLLLIACANLANLLLGRTAARRKELAVRMALGAGRGRIIRQIVTEALVLAAIGAAAGVALGYTAMTVFVGIGRDSIPRPDSISIDTRVMAFAFAVTLVSALLSALVPAWQASRAAAADGLREGGRQGAPSASRRTRSVLVAAEVALAFVLLAGAGLLIRTLWSLQSVDRGWNASRIAMATVSPPASSYPRPQDVSGFYARVLDRLRTAPGVESAALTTGVLQPLVTRSSIFSIEGRPLPPPEERIEYPYEVVSPAFFETLSIELAAGRTFADSDTDDAPGVVIVNQTFARSAWPGQDALGRRIRGGGDNSRAPWLTVVGVIRDVRRGDVTRAVRPELYFCANQVAPRTMTIVVRAADDPAALLGTLRREVQGIDGRLPIFRAGTLEGEIARTLSQPRFQATLLGWFAAIAVLLATIGIYGVTSYAVSQRTHEVGIRMALGASRRTVVRLLLAQHLLPAAVGLAIGMTAAVVLTRSMRTLLYGVGVYDPPTFATMAAGLIAVAVVACWVPARRAMRVDPLDALRAD